MELHRHGQRGGAAGVTEGSAKSRGAAHRRDGPRCAPAAAKAHAPTGGGAGNPAVAAAEPAAHLRRRAAAVCHPRGADVVAHRRRLRLALEHHLEQRGVGMPAGGEASDAGGAWRDGEGASAPPSLPRAPRRRRARRACTRGAARDAGASSARHARTAPRHCPSGSRGPRAVCRPRAGASAGRGPAGGRGQTVRPRARPAGRAGYQPDGAGPPSLPALPPVVAGGRRAREARVEGSAQRAVLLQQALRLGVLEEGARRSQGLHGGGGARAGAGWFGRDAGSRLKPRPWPPGWPSGALRGRCRASGGRARRRRAPEC
jgi:hypothetical protein